MTIQWREEMTVDHGMIDHDHQTLIAIINAFCDATPSADALPELQAILDKLERYTAEHFGREEALQHKAQYAFLEAHHHEHLDLIRELTEIRRHLTVLVTPSGEPADIPDTQAGQTRPGLGAKMDGVAAFHAEMAAFLRHWLVDHIIKSDLRMKPYAAKMAMHTSRLGGLGQPGVPWKTLDC
jgi:hemerythrin